MTHVRTGVNDLGGDFGFGPDSDTLVLGEFLNKFLLGECPGLVVDLGSVDVLPSILSSASPYLLGFFALDTQSPSFPFQGSLCPNRLLIHMITSPILPDISLPTPLQSPSSHLSPLMLTVPPYLNSESRI